YRISYRACRRCKIKLGAERQRRNQARIVEPFCPQTETAFDGIGVYIEDGLVGAELGCVEYVPRLGSHSCQPFGVLDAVFPQGALNDEFYVSDRYHQPPARVLDD